MVPNEPDALETVDFDDDSEQVDDDELFDFDDELPAGEGVFAESTDDFGKAAQAKVALTDAPPADAEALLKAVARSKKKKLPRSG